MVLKIHMMQAIIIIGMLTFRSRRWNRRTHTDSPNIQTEKPAIIFISLKLKNAQTFALTIQYPLDGKRYDGGGSVVSGD
jgi:hypothetical protein